MVSSYYGWSSAEYGIELRAIGGYGYGDFIINQKDYPPLLLNSSHITTSLNGVANITSFGTEQRHGLNHINLKFDSSMMQFVMHDKLDFIADYKFNSNLNRLTSEYIYQKTFEQGSTLSSIAQFAGVWGRNYTNEKIGIELSGGLEVTNLTGFEFSGNGQYLLNQTDNFFESAGVKGEINFDKNNDRLGLQAKISSSYGSISNQKISDIEIWNDFDHGLTRNNPTMNATSEIAWGLNFATNAIELTPYYGVNIVDLALSSQSLGTKVRLGTNSYFAVKGTQERRTNSIANYKMGINGKFTW